MPYRRQRGAMSRFLLWIFPILGFWMLQFWCCRAILVYPQNTLLQVPVESNYRLFYTQTDVRERNESPRAMILQEKNQCLRKVQFLSVELFTLGVSVPVAMTKRGGFAFNSGFQINYALPWNVSQFEPTIIPARHIRDLDLQDTYVAIENLLDEYGWRDGRQCFLRSICELAGTPLLRSHQDILEEVIHLILTPTEDLPVAINSSYRNADKLYQEAERLGRSGGDCILTYPDCIESPLESFTEIVFP